MMLFKKSKKKIAGDYNVLNDNYEPTSLPTYGQGLENFVTADYPMNRLEIVEATYRDAESKLSEFISTCDHFASGAECDVFIDGQMEHVESEHMAAIANRENQMERIRSAREMRKKALEREISPLKEKIAKLQAEIAPLEELRSQFQLKIGRFSISWGIPITILAMIVDSVVNYSFLQSVLLSNATMLMITVICLSIMSDGTMWALGTFLSRKEEKFISKPLFWTLCVGFFSMFLLSIVTSVMVRFGSMDATYGTINAAGKFVGKEAYSLAEYGVTLATAFLTTCTGILSFAFSFDKNAFLVSQREQKKKELEKCLAEHDALVNERELLENAPDPREWDERKRAAAEHQMEALRCALKLHCRKLLACRMNEPDFTERMAESGEALLGKASAAELSPIPTVNPLNKVS